MFTKKGSQILATTLCICMACSFYAMAASVYTFIVEDDGKITKIYSLENNIDMVYEQIEPKIDPLDVVIVRANYAYKTTKIELYRAIEVQLVIDGKEPQTVRARQNETVEALLTRLEIPFSAEALKDGVTPLQLAKDVKVIKLLRDYVETVEELEEFAFPVLRKPSDDLKPGEEKTLTVGVPGLKRVTYEHTYKNGVRVSRIDKRTVIVKQPVPQVVSYGFEGSKVGNATISANKIVMADGKVYTYKSTMTVKAYAYTTEGMKGKGTFSGQVARVGLIAVDPKVIKLGTKMYIHGIDGSWTYGFCVAADTGGAIKGNVVDLFYNTEAECRRFGVKKAKIYFLE